MSDATLIIEVQAGAAFARLTPVEAMELSAELDAVFSRLFPAEPEPEPASPPAPVYVPWQPWILWPNQPWIGPWAQTPPIATLTTTGGGVRWVHQDGSTLCANTAVQP